MIQWKNVFSVIMEVHDFTEKHQEGKDIINVLHTSYGGGGEQKNRLNNLRKLCFRT